MVNKKLLETRNRMKKIKPKFERKDVNVYPSFKGKWRRPKGLHNKMRNAFRGHKAMPNIGYASPSVVKGLNRAGLKEVLINNISQLDKITKENTIIISGKIGIKKKIGIVAKAIELKILISNLKDPSKYISEIKEKIELKKKENTKKKHARETSKAEASKSQEENKNKEKKLNESQK